MKRSTNSAYPEDTALAYGLYVKPINSTGENGGISRVISFEIILSVLPNLSEATSIMLPTISSVLRFTYVCRNVDGVLQNKRLL